MIVDQDSAARSTTDICDIPSKQGVCWEDIPFSFFFSFHITQVLQGLTVILSTNPLRVTGTSGQHLSQGYLETEDIRRFPFPNISYDGYADTIFSAIAPLWCAGLW